MPDLIKTPSNRRYVVNFQNKEPQNKYDIWLSKNKHDLSGKTIVDSEYLSDSDLVFKIYMNGKWVPILGIPVSYEGIIQAIEDLDKKKMNLIKPTPLVDGHIPVIHQGSDECDQLIDGGDIGDIIEQYINGGGAIPIQRATVDTLGGVKAGLHIHNNNPDQYVEAKFKFPEGYDEGGIVENDRLYISASEIIQAINTYIGGGGTGIDLPLMGPTTRGGAMANLVPATWEANRYIPVLINQSNEYMYINGEDVLSVLEYILENDPLASIYEAGEGIDITENVISNTQATDIATGGVRVRQNPDTTNERRGAEIMYGNGAVVDAISGRTVDNKHLCVDVDQIVELVTNQESTDNPIVIGERGIDFYLKNIGNDIYRTCGYITGVGPTNIGKYLKVNADGSDIEWDTPSGGQTYPALASNTPAGTDCVITAPNKQEGFLRWDGTFVSIPTGSTVTWSQIWNTGTKIAEISIDGNTTDIYAPNTIYTAGLGIAFGNNNSINIDINGANNGEVLSYNGNGFDWVPQTSYTQKEGVVVDNVNHTVGGMITVNNSNYAARTSLAFNCTYGTAQNPITGIEAVIDGVSTDLLKYSYNEIEIVVTDSVSLVFNVSLQKTYMQGIPVYALLTVDGKTDGVKVSVADSDSLGLININEAVSTDYSSNSCLNPLYSKFLITMQFGIVKIEPLEGTTTNNDNNDNE